MQLIYNWTACHDICSDDDLHRKKATDSGDQNVVPLDHYGNHIMYLSYFLTFWRHQILPVFRTAEEPLLSTSSLCLFGFFLFF